jgi:hypothetical protein
MSSNIPDLSSTPSLTAAELLRRVVAVRDLNQARFTPPSWLWHGNVGPGKVTLLSCQWKSGKTTLVSLLLARMQQGGQLAGLPVAPGKAFVISEESQADWRLRFTRSESPTSASPTAERLSPEAGQSVAPEAPVRLPYPFNMMNPADVPQEVWRQARAAHQTTW